jgi:hypothetical protein
MPKYQELEAVKHTGFTGNEGRHAEALKAAFAEADRLGYPVLVDGAHFDRKKAAMEAIEKGMDGGKSVTIARPGPQIDEAKPAPKPKA